MTWKVNPEDRRGFRYKQKHTPMYGMLSEVSFIFKLEFWFRALGVSRQKEKRENATIKLTPVSWGSPRCSHTMFSPAANVFYHRILTALYLFCLLKHLPFFALRASMDYILVSPHSSNVYRPSSVMVSSGRDFGRRLVHRIQPSWMGLSVLIKETPKSIPPSFPCCEDTMKRPKCATLKRMLTRTPSCWHPDLGF